MLEWWRECAGEGAPKAGNACRVANRDGAWGECGMDALLVYHGPRAPTLFSPLATRNSDTKP
jgi:hypothetical protein